MAGVDTRQRLAHCGCVCLSCLFVLQARTASSSRRCLHPGSGVGRVEPALPVSPRLPMFHTPFSRCVQRAKPCARQLAGAKRCHGTTAPAAADVHPQVVVPPHVAQICPPPATNADLHDVVIRPQSPQSGRGQKHFHPFVQLMIHRGGSPCIYLMADKEDRWCGLWPLRVYRHTAVHVDGPQPQGCCTRNAQEYRSQ